MKRIATLLIIVCLPIFVHSQMKLDWAVANGSDASDFIHSIAVDSDKNSYHVGSFTNTVDFDPGIGIAQFTSNGSLDGYVQKLDANGNHVWVRTFGGIQWDRVNDVTAHNDSFIYTVGSFVDTVDIDPGSGVNIQTSNYETGVIHKFDLDGNLIWVRSLEVDTNILSYVRMKYVRTSTTGDVYMTGFYYGTVDFDPGSNSTLVTSNGNSDIFILKLDASGNFLWVASMGGTEKDFGYSIGLDAQGNVYGTGCFEGVADFDPSAATFNVTGNGSDDWYVVKLNSNGNLEWVHGFGWSDSDYAESIAVDAAGNSYTTGTFRGLIDFDPGPGSFNMTATSHPFLMKLDTYGDFVWAKKFDVPNPGTASGKDVEIGVSNTLFWVGEYLGTIDLDPNSGTDFHTSVSVDPCAARLDQNGNYIWGVSWGDTQEDHAYAIASDADSSAYVVGNYVDDSDFDPGPSVYAIPTVGGSLDRYILKLDQCTGKPDTSVTNVVACNSYTWVNGVTYTNDTDSVMVTVQNHEGCDSVLVLNLDINYVDVTTTFVDDITISSNAIGVTYQWTDCTNGFAPVPGETNQQFTATANGSYAVIVTGPNNCMDTSDCVTISNIGLEEQTTVQFNVYPNPAESVFKVVSNVTGRIEICDVSGKCLKEIPLKAFEEISVTDLSNGVYILRFENSNIRIIRRIAVAH